MARVRLEYRHKDLRGSTVVRTKATLYEPGTTDEVTGVYDAETGGSALSYPLVADEHGYIVAWLDTAQDLELVVTDENDWRLHESDDRPFVPAGDLEESLASLSSTYAARVATTPSPVDDALAAKVAARVKVFTDYLTATGNAGDIGEWGIPTYVAGTTTLLAADELARWQSLGEKIMARFDERSLPVTAWDVREYNPTVAAATPLYLVGDGSAPLSTPGPQGYWWEKHTGEGRGVCYATGLTTGMSGLGGTTEPFSNARDTRTFEDPPTTGTARYNYGTAATYTMLGQRGHKVVRLIFRWERVQRTISGALDTTEMARIDAAIAAIKAAGMQAILYLGNFGAYYLDNGTVGVRKTLGSAEVPNSALSDLWTRMEARYAAEPAVLGYDIMAEPASSILSYAQWETASQAVVTALRAAGSTKRLYIEPIDGSPDNLSSGRHNSAGWITDPGSNFRYSVHIYPDGGGSFVSSYETTLRAAVDEGYKRTQTYPLDDEWLKGLLTLLLPVYEPWQAKTTNEVPATAASGQTWAKSDAAGIWVKDSTTFPRVAYSGGGPTAIAALTLADTTKNYRIRQRIQLGSARANIGVTFGYIDKDNCLIGKMIKSATTDGFRLAKYDGGTLTNLATLDTAGLALDSQYTLEVTVEGAVVKLFSDGVEKLTYTLTAGEQTKYLPTTTRKGLWVTQGGGGTDDDGTSRWVRPFSVRPAQWTTITAP